MLLISLTVSCGKDPSAPVPDTTAPLNVDDLAISSSTSSSITLTWTAPGDDGTAGTAAQYDIRYTTSGINDANFDSATQAVAVPTPNEAGTGETFTITELTENTTYHFALKAADEVQNWSTLSNVATGA